MYTLDIEMTPQERAEVVRALQALAEQEDAQDNPGEADRLRGLAGRIERE